MRRRYLASAISAFRLKGWAWSLSIWLEILSLIYTDINTATGGGTGAGNIISVIIALLLLYYLFRPNVRQAFGKGAAA